MPYVWSPILETGHEKVDEQHRQLFNALNNIVVAYREKRGSQEIIKTLFFLTNYTVMHFSTEEELMLKFNYPDYDAHKKNHEDFKVTVLEFMQKFQDEGPSEDLIVNVTSAVGDWLLSHIRVDDKKMASYVLEKADNQG
ncbi:MAG: bacteriohemerythrin [Treponema sp.]|jgi:hemerythrin|nr:bacteriohemerythrin [Treponema sp.]